MATGRALGKTAHMLQWLLKGERTDSFPGWTRVMLCANAHQKDVLCRTHRGSIEDVVHRVFTVDEWVQARNVDIKTEVGVDNAEMVLASMLRFNGRLTTMTMTAEVVDNLFADPIGDSVANDRPLASFLTDFDPPHPDTMANA